MNFLDDEPIKQIPTMDDVYSSLKKTRKGKHEEHERFQLIRETYRLLVRPKLEKARIVKLSKQELIFIRDFSSKKTTAKNQEWGNTDARSRGLRNQTGSLLEYAFLKFYDKQMYFDNAVVSNSFEKNEPDLISLSVIADLKGCKTDSLPLVFKSARYYKVRMTGPHKGKSYKCSNIIGVVDSNNDTVYLLGIATPSVLKKYIDDNLIGSADNNTKSGFYGVHYLIDIPKSWDELKTICNNNLEF